MRLQQGLATGEIGFTGQFARQQSEAAHVRFGSKADIGQCRADVRFTPIADIGTQSRNVRFVPKADIEVCRVSNETPRDGGLLCLRVARRLQPAERRLDCPCGIPMAIYQGQKPAIVIANLLIDARVEFVV
jgi:hypothetical protein